MMHLIWQVLLHGGFGTSWYTVLRHVRVSFPVFRIQLLLGIMSNAFVIVFGIPLGVIAAVKQNSKLDYFTLIVAMFLSSMPAFWFGLMAQILFCLTLGWFPATGAETLKNFILPSITLACASFAGIVRLTRTSILEVNKLDYVRTARSKGCSEFRL